MNVDPKLEDVIRGMVNCYRTCGENFENTVGMVARNRGLTPNQVKQMLKMIKDEFPDVYQRYRVKLPADFPF